MQKYNDLLRYEQYLLQRAKSVYGKVEMLLMESFKSFFSTMNQR